MSVLEPRRVLVTSEVAQRDPLALERFRQAGFELVERYDLNACRHDATLREALTGMWGSLAGTERYTRAVLEGSTTLRVVARCGVGYDTVDVAAASAAGVAVLTTPGANVGAVADFTLALMLSSLQRLQVDDDRHRARAEPPAAGGRPLAGATVGVVGLGAIGRAVVERLQGFGCRILGVDPLVGAEECHRIGVENGDLHAVLPRVDVLTLHVPLTPHTRGMIGPDELALLPSGAVVVNTARGGIVDEGALVRELASGRLWGAGLDVFADEPMMPNHPLTSLETALLGGHVASFTLGSVRATLEGALAGLQAVSAGRVPDSCVNDTELRAVGAGDGRPPTDTLESASADR